MVKDLKKTVIVATHDPELTQLADRVLSLEEGRLSSQG